MRNNVVYARTCLKGSNLDEQMNMINQYAKDNNIDISDYYIDDGYTGHDKNRPGLNKLLKDISLNKIGVVIVTSYDRLTRNYLMANKYSYFFEKYNVELKILDGGFDDEKFGSYICEILYGRRNKG